MDSHRDHPIPISYMTSPPPPKRHSFPALWPIVVGLLALHYALGLTATLDKCTTFDEIAHLTAGYSKWQTGDFRLVPEHPPLAQLWAALPLKFLSPPMPSLHQPAWWTSDQWKFGDQFFYAAGNDPQRLLLAGRSMIGFFSIALGLTVFVVSRRMFGPVGGLISLALYVFCPTMLANGFLVTTDMSAALFFLLATVGIDWSLKRVTCWSVMLSGLALGGLFIAKMSAVMILPVYGLLLAIRLAQRRPLDVLLPRATSIAGRIPRFAVHAAVLVVQLAIVTMSIWACYGIRYAAMVDGQSGRDRLGYIGHEQPIDRSAWDIELQNIGKAGPPIAFARDHCLLPESYLYGFAYALDMTEGRDAFLNGRRTLEGFRSFFPYCFLYKSTLPMLAILLLAVAGLAVQFRSRSSSSSGGQPTEPAQGMIPLLVLFVLYWAFAIASPLNIGHRHLLPIYPILFILAGATAALWQRWRRAAAPVTAVVLALHAGASLRTWPNFLAYFNSIAGGPSGGYRHLVDSSLDWGQDLPGLKRWLEANTASAAQTARTNQAAVFLSYFGTGEPSFYGINATRLQHLPPISQADIIPLTEGVYCISATNIQQVLLLPISRWTRGLERLYGQFIPSVKKVQHHITPTSQASSSPALPQDEFAWRLCFGRLCAALRRREPDAQVGHSILIFRVSGEELNTALFGAPPAEDDDDAEGLFRLAEELAQSGLPEQAVACYRESLRLDPSRSKARNNLAAQLGRLRRFDEALTELNETIRQDPAYAEAFVNLGAISAVLGRPNEAISYYKKALELDGEMLGARSDLASLLLRTGKKDAAIEQYKTALRQMPGNASLHFDLAEALIGIGQIKEAVEQYEMVLRLEPTNAAAARRLAQIRARNSKAAPVGP